MSNQKTLGLTREEQVEEFENAEGIVRDDFGEDITYGEVVQRLAQAYAGTLDGIPEG